VSEREALIRECGVVLARLTIEYQGGGLDNDLAELAGRAVLALEDQPESDEGQALAKKLLERLEEESLQMPTAMAGGEHLDPGAGLDLMIGPLRELLVEGEG
jgi:hypothetical protein